jgi:foldase protein PrsA
VSRFARPVRLVLVPALTALLALALAACSSARPPAAVVNGTRITDEQVQENVPLFQFLASIQNSACGQVQAGERPDAACTRSVLTNLIEEQIVLPFARSHHLSVPSSQIDQTISSLDQSVGADKVTTLLKAQGLTTSDLRGLLSRLLLIQAAEQEVVKEQVSDADLRKLYEQNKLQFTQLHAKHILVKTQAEAEKIAKEATPQNFAKLAEKFSIDTGSAKNGGDLGTVTAAQFDPDFVNAALALSPGQISGPVHTQFGWHVIMLVSAQVVPFDQAKQQLLTQEGNGPFVDWIKGRLRSATVEVNPKYGRYDPSTGGVVPITSTATRLPSSPTSTP